MRLKNQRHELFAQNVAKGMSHADAYRGSGYKAKGHAVYVRASALVRKSEVDARIDELAKKAEDKAIMTIAERKRVLSEMGRGKLQDYLAAGEDDDAAHINLGPDSPNPAAVQEVTLLTKRNEDGQGWTTTSKIKLHDPVKAIGELNKMDGAYAPKQIDIGGDLTVLVEDKDDAAV